MSAGGSACRPVQKCIKEAEGKNSPGKDAPRETLM